MLLEALVLSQQGVLLSTARPRALHGLGERLLAELSPANPKSLGKAGC